MTSKNSKAVSEDAWVVTEGISDKGGVCWWVNRGDGSLVAELGSKRDAELVSRIPEMVEALDGIMETEDPYEAKAIADSMLTLISEGSGNAS